MKNADFEWQRPQERVLSAEFTQAIKEKNLSPLLGNLLWQRNIKTPEELEKFLFPSLEHLYDPFLFYQMEQVVERIQEAIVKGEKILVYGDYDADGITSATIMKETLELLGAEVVCYLPNRFNDGYGPNKRVYEEKIAEGIQLIITVDNGVSGHEAIEFANSQGVDVIVTDHHELPQTLPAAYAIIHPRHPLGSYPFKDLAGVGVAFKVACALLDEVPREFLDLVAIGTVADMVSLTNENRVLVKNGLEYLKQTDRMGLSELIKVSGIKRSEITESSIGFSIGPRLNAIGRLGDPNPAVTLLTTFDPEEAHQLAEEMDSINNSRKEYVDKIMEEALTMLDADNQIHLIAGKDWYEGVLGIVAGRIVSQTGRPAIVMTIKENGIAKGSGRSVAALNLFGLLENMKELFESFGGHHAAVGLSMPQENLAVLQKQMNQFVIENQVDLTKGIPLAIDEKLTFSDVSIPFIEALKALAPFGTDNPTPKFLFEKVAAKDIRQIGSTKQHLKLQLADSSNDKLDAIGFGFGVCAEEFASETVSIVGELSVNEWNGNKKPQLMLADFEVEGLQIFDYRSKKNRQAGEFSEKTLCISFSEKADKELKALSKNIYCFSTIEQLDNHLKSHEYDQLAILDCPEEPETIKQIINSCGLSRIYLVLISHEDAYLDGLGTREQYGSLFKFLATQKSVDIRYKSKIIADFLKIPEKLLIFMIRVFFDLEFVTIDDGVLRKIENPVNKPLPESALYQKRQQRIRTEEFLLMSDIATIKNWLMS